KETVAGYLAPTAGVAKVMVPRAGTITTVHIREGQAVAEGEPLLTVAVDQTAADGRNIDAAMLATLQGQRSALAEQIAMQQGRAASERARLTAQIVSAREEIAHIEEQIE